MELIYTCEREMLLLSVRVNTETKTLGNISQGNEVKFTPYKINHHVRPGVSVLRDHR